jgi:hypothetical protein
LWQAEDGVVLNQGLTAFNTAFEQIPNPKKALTFLNNLLKAAQQVPTLAVELRDRKFLDALIQFGLTASQLNMGQATGTEPLWFFLDTLWNADTPGEIRLGARQLSEFFKEAETSEKRLKLLEFSNNLLQAARLAPTLQQQVKDPYFIYEVVEFGSDYSGLQLGTLPELTEEPYEFLNVLRRSEAAVSIAVKDIPDAMALIVRNSFSKVAWGHCLRKYGVDLTIRTISVARAWALPDLR